MSARNEVQKTYDSPDEAYSEETGDGGSGQFIRFTPGETTLMRIVGLPVKFKKTWEDGRVQTRFAWPVIEYILGPDNKVKERHVKILDGGGSIYGAIKNLANDEEWGDPTTYDIKIKREGEGMQTRYNVVPGKKRPLLDADKAAIEEAQLDVRAVLMSSGRSADDPFADE